MTSAACRPFGSPSLGVVVGWRAGWGHMRGHARGHPLLRGGEGRAGRLGPDFAVSPDVRGGGWQGDFAITSYIN